MRFFLLLSVFVLVSSSDEEIYNRMFDDSIVCAMGNSPDVERFEECPIWPETGFFPFCVYVRTPSTENRSGYSTYGCIYSHRLPPECLERGEFYTEFAEGKVKGAMMCCSESYCNRLDDPMVAMVRLAEAKNEESAWPAVFMGIVLIGLSIAPLAQWYLKKRHENDSQQAEASEFIAELVCQDAPEFKLLAKPEELSMTFSSYRKMLRTVKEISHMHRYRSGSSWNSDNLHHVLMNPNSKKEEVDKEPELMPHVNVFQRCNGQPGPVVRQYPSRFEHLAERMIEHGPFRFKFDPVELGDLFDSCATILKREPTLLRLDGGVIVYGNLDGSYGDLFRWMHKNGWPPSQKVVFLGGLSSPEEPLSLETVALIFALKKMLPYHVYILRGPAETYPLNLRQRMPTRMADSLSEVIFRAYQYLPLAALVGHNILLCHGCVPRKMKHIKDISQIHRPLKDVSMGSVAADLIFSKIGTVNELIGGARGSRFSCDFEPDIHTGISKEHKIKMVIRSRNSCPDGFMVHNNKLLTIWSSCTNETLTKAERDIKIFDETKFSGASLYIEPSLKIIITKMAPYNKYDGKLIAMEKKKEEKDKSKKKKVIGVQATQESKEAGM